MKLPLLKFLASALCLSAIATRSLTASPAAAATKDSSRRGSTMPLPWLSASSTRFSL